MNTHNLSFAKHAATNISAIGFGNDYKQFKLFCKPGVTKDDDDSNSTYLYYESRDERWVHFKNITEG